MRNILETVPKKNFKSFREAMKAVFRFTDIRLARVTKNELVSAYAENKRYEKSCQKLNEGFEDAFQYTVMNKVHSRLKSTNLLERLNQEVR